MEISQVKIINNPRNKLELTKVSFQTRTGGYDKNLHPKISRFI